MATRRVHQAPSGDIWKLREKYNETTINTSVYGDANVHPIKTSDPIINSIAKMADTILSKPIADKITPGPLETDGTIHHVTDIVRDIVETKPVADTTISELIHRLSAGSSHNIVYFNTSKEIVLDGQVASFIHIGRG